MRIPAQLAFCVAGLTLCSLADTDYSTWVQLTADDGAQPYSFDSAGKWSDPNPPDPAKKYYVPAGRLMKTSGMSVTFGGGVIAVAGTVQVGNTGATTVTWPELRLLPGGLYKHNSNNYIGGKLVILGTEAEPARINSFFFNDNKNVSYRYFCSFEGEPGSVVRIGHASLVDAPHERIVGTTVTLEGSLDAFKGRFIVGGETHLVTKSQTAIPGGVHVESTGILHSEKTSGTVTIGDLSLADGAEVMFNFNACASMHWVVTNSLTLAGSPRVWFNLFDVGPGNTNGVTVFRLTGPAAANAPSAETVSAMWAMARFGQTPLPRNVHMELVDNGDGTKDIRVAYDGIVTMRTHNHAYTAEESAFVAGNESWWSTGEIPGEDFEGDVYCAWYRLMAIGWNTHLNYPQMELHTRGALHAHVLKLTLKHLHLDGHGTNSVATYSGPYTTEMDTPITFYPGRVVFTGRSNRGFVFTREMDGRTEVSVKSNMPSNNPFSVTFAATSANTNFTGSFCFTDYAVNYDEATGYDKATRVTLSDGRNLGGVYEGDYVPACRAVTFENYVYVTAAASLDFTEPTRGFCVVRGARLDVPAGKTVRIGAPFTFAGELVKLGEGALVLGGPARFIDGAEDTAPLAGTNVLTVSAGTVGVAATNALDGVAVSFADGAALAVDPGVADADVRAYGAVNLKWSQPFTAAGGGALSVAFDRDYSPDGRCPVFAAAICTVSAEVAQGLSFSPQNGYRGFRLRIEPRTNADGSVTFLARFTHKAISISFR